MPEVPAEILQGGTQGLLYALWAVIAVLSGVCALLWRTLQGEREKRVSDLLTATDAVKEQRDYNAALRESQFQQQLKTEGLLARALAVIERAER